MSTFRASGSVPDPAEPLNSIASALADTGYAVILDFLDRSLVASLRQELLQYREENRLLKAAVGLGHEKELRAEIRSDQIFWLEKGALSAPQQEWWSRMDALRLILNQTLFLGLFEFESHLARFPEASHYRPHKDRHRDKSERLVTVISYLNPQWAPEDGGQLRLYTDAEQGVSGPSIDIPPEAGTMVVFLSGDFWHEVRPAHRERFSITGWFRQRDSTTPLPL